MSEEERRERHRQNFMHVATHTAQVRDGACVLSGLSASYSGIADSQLYAAKMQRTTRDSFLLLCAQGRQGHCFVRQLLHLQDTVAGTSLPRQFFHSW
jgi:hypothetical protein